MWRFVRGIESFCYSAKILCRALVRWAPPWHSLGTPCECKLPAVHDPMMVRAFAVPMGLEMPFLSASQQRILIIWMGSGGIHARVNSKYLEAAATCLLSSRVVLPICHVWLPFHVPLLLSRNLAFTCCPCISVALYTVCRSS